MANQTKRDILLVALDGGRLQPAPLVATPADEHQPAISPDGRWLAYMSDESGREGVYVPGAFIGRRRGGFAQYCLASSAWYGSPGIAAQ